MRFLVSVAVIVSPLACLVAVFALDDAARQTQRTTLAQQRAEPASTGSIDPGPARIVPNTLGRWRASLRLTPEQTAEWLRLEPGTARALATAPAFARQVCGGGSEAGRDPARASRVAEREARFAPVRHAWAQMEASLSPRQTRRFRAVVAPRLAAAFDPRAGGCAAARGDRSARG